MNTSNVEFEHPGRILSEQFMEPMHISSLRLSIALRVESRRLLDLIHGKRRISPETAMRLARYFNTSPEYWLELQLNYDLKVAERKWSEKIEREINPLSESITVGLVPEEARAVKEKKVQANPILEKLKKEIENLQGNEKRVFEMLGSKPITFDSIAYALDMGGGALGGTLVMLELNGLIK